MNLFNFSKTLFPHWRREGENAGALMTTAKGEKYSWSTTSHEMQLTVPIARMLPLQTTI